MTTGTLARELNDNTRQGRPWITQRAGGEDMVAGLTGYGGDASVVQPPYAAGSVFCSALIMRPIRASQSSSVVW